MRVATERKILNKVLSIPLEFGPTVACEHVGRIRRNRIWILICHVRLHLWNVITRLSFVNELSTDYIFSAARSHIRNNKSFKNVFFEKRPYNYIRSVISTSAREDLAKYLFLLLSMHVRLSNTFVMNA